MPFQQLDAPQRQVWFRIHGVMTPDDFRQIQQRIEAGTPEAGARVLVLLDGFEGWSKDHSWENSAFLADRVFDKGAIVGERRWEAEMALFLGLPMRDADIRYFPDTSLSDAKVWLDE